MTCYKCVSSAFFSLKCPKFLCPLDPACSVNVALLFALSSTENVCQKLDNMSMRSMQSVLVPIFGIHCGVSETSLLPDTKDYNTRTSRMFCTEWPCALCKRCTHWPLLHGQHKHQLCQTWCLVDQSLGIGSSGRFRSTDARRELAGVELPAMPGWRRHTSNPCNRGLRFGRCNLRARCRWLGPGQQQRQWGYDEWCGSWYLSGGNVGYAHGQVPR